MHIKTLEVGSLPTNCYIVADPATKAAAIIDPGDDSPAIMEYIASEGLKPQVIFLTHGHYDHTMAVDDLATAFSIPAYIHEKEVDISGKSPYTFLPVADTRHYDDGDQFHVGELLFTVLHTPGHSRGSVCLQVEDCLFTGDTLFRDDCGRCDLEGGDYPTMLKSLARLDKLEGIEDVFPGHMDATTLERERRFNQYIKTAAQGGNV